MARQDGWIREILPRSASDFDVDGADFGQRQFNSGGPLSSLAVPEPTSLGLLAIAGLTLFHASRIATTDVKLADVNLASNHQKEALAICTSRLATC